MAQYLRSLEINKYQKNQVPERFFHVLYVYYTYTKQKGMLERTIGN